MCCFRLRKVAGITCFLMISLLLLNLSSVMGGYAAGLGDEFKVNTYATLDQDNPATESTLRGSKS